jgi:hypothetical protein
VLHRYCTVFPRTAVLHRYCCDVKVSNNKIADNSRDGNNNKDASNSRVANNYSRGTGNDGNTDSRISILNSSQPDNSGRRLAEIGPISEDDFIESHHSCFPQAGIP